MGQHISVQAEAREGEQRCRHHWIIESPQGAISKGVCKLCGQQREFRNSFEGLWDRDPLPEGGSGHWRTTAVKEITRDEVGTPWEDEDVDL